MKTTAVRRLALLFCALFLAQTMTACSDTPAETESTENDTAAVTETVDPEAERLAEKEAYYSALNKVSEPGVEISFLSETGDIAVEEITGEKFNDAMYNRNLEVEERLDVTLNVLEQDDNVATIIANNVISGDGTYDVISARTQFVATMLQNGHLLDMNTIPNMQLEEKWWNQSAIKNFSLAGFQYCVLSELCHLTRTTADMILMNKELCIDHGMEVPYDAVREGKWTYDMMYEMCQQLPYDSNGDGVMDWNDTRGFTGGSVFITYAMVAGGVDYFVKDENDIPVFSLMSETNVNYFDRLFNILSDRDRFLYYDNTTGLTNGWSFIVNKFLSGDSLFLQCSPGGMPTYSQMEQDYSVLPLPKIDESQESYRSKTSDGFSSVICVSKVFDAEDGDIGLVLDAMSFLSQVDLLPTYVNSYLESRWVRDEDSVEMMQIAFENIYFDPAFVLDSVWGDPMDVAGSVFNSGSNTFVSTVKSKQPAIEAAVQRTVENLNK